MKKKNPEILTPEWSHKVAAAEIGDASMTMKMRASAEECRDVARRLKVSAIEDLRAEGTLRREPGGQVIAVSGRFAATVTQPCIITGDPVQAEVSEPFEGWYGEEGDVVSLTQARRAREGNRIRQSRHRNKECGPVHRPAADARPQATNRPASAQAHPRGGHHPA